MLIALWQVLVRLQTRLLERMERCFPLVPELTQAEVEAAGGRWLPEDVYFFLDDDSPRLGQRWKAVLTRDRHNVSFWRKRSQKLKERAPRRVFIVTPPYSEPEPFWHVCETRSTGDLYDIYAIDAYEIWSYEISERDALISAAKLGEQNPVLV